MRLRWRLILPIIALTLFAGETYRSVQMNRGVRLSPSRYFWWSFIRLDSHPLNRHPGRATPCEDGTQNCVTWDLPNMWVDPGAIEEALMISALPAFATAELIVGGLERLGVNEIWSFMISMPLLIFGWFYFVGWLIDRWGSKRPRHS